MDLRHLSDLVCRVVGEWLTQQVVPKYRFVERKFQVRQQMRCTINHGGKNYLLIIEETT